MEEPWDNLAGRSFERRGSFELLGQDLVQSRNQREISSLAAFSFARLQPQASRVEVDMMLLPRENLRLDTPSGELCSICRRFLRALRLSKLRYCHPECAESEWPRADQRSEVGFLAGQAVVSAHSSALNGLSRDNST